MAKAKSKTTKTSKAPEAPSIDEAMTGAAEFANESMDALNKTFTASAKTMRELGERNLRLMTRTFEQGFETSQAMTSAKDFREAVEVQTGFAKSVFSAYNEEAKNQTKLLTEFWREAAKPMQERMSFVSQKFQSAL